MIKNSECCLTAIHYKTKEMVYFLESVRAIKESKRPELRDRNGDFIKKRVAETIRNPNFVYEDLYSPNTRSCLYVREYAVGKKIWYVKVILEYIKSEKHFSVITTFRSNSVKERGKTDVIYGIDDEK